MAAFFEEIKKKKLIFLGRKEQYKIVILLDF